MHYRASRVRRVGGAAELYVRWSLRLGGAAPPSAVALLRSQARCALHSRGEPPRTRSRGVWLAHHAHGG
jgi:hypothetical protein